VIQAVLFDLDGTFADTAPDLGAALNHVRTLRDLPPLPIEIIRLQASNGSRGLLKLGLNIEPDAPDYDELRDAFLQHYEAHICDHTTLFPGMAALVSELERHDVQWCIVTNKPHRYTVPLMEKLGYASRAACLVSGDTCPRSKPHPMPLLHAAELMGVEPAQCLFLGDDLRDMEAAKAAEMTGIIAGYGYVDPAADLSSWPAAGNVPTPFALLRYIQG
jgi:phosphoglycolate phosphatase